MGTGERGGEAEGTSECTLGGKEKKKERKKKTFAKLNLLNLKKGGLKENCPNYSRPLHLLIDWLIDWLQGNYDYFNSISEQSKHWLDQSINQLKWEWRKMMVKIRMKVCGNRLRHFCLSFCASFFIYFIQRHLAGVLNCFSFLFHFCF